MIAKRSNVENNIDFNNVDKSNRSINKQNRERFDDFSQQFHVNDFHFLNIDFFSNYIFYQFQNFAYQNQKYQYQFFDEKKQQFFVVLFAMLFSRKSLQIIFENAFDSKIRNQISKQQ